MFAIPSLSTNKRGDRLSDNNQHGNESRTKEFGKGSKLTRVNSQACDEDRWNGSWRGRWTRRMQRVFSALRERCRSWRCPVLWWRGCPCRTRRSGTQGSCRWRTVRPSSPSWVPCTGVASLHQGLLRRLLHLQGWRGAWFLPWSHGQRLPFRYPSVQPLRLLV